MPPSDLDTPMYYTTAPCGCVKLMMVDTPERARDVAKELAKAVRAGEVIYRGTVRDAREGRVSPGWCDTCRPGRKKRAAAEQQEMSL